MMEINQILDEILFKYDIYHSSIIIGSKVQLSINYNQDSHIKVSLVRVFNNKTDKIEYSFVNDDNFSNSIFPKIIMRFFTKNSNLNKRTIMGTSESGTYYVERGDNKESLTVRNCPLSIMEILKMFEEESKKLKANGSFSGINIFTPEEEKYVRYMKFNIALVYANYRKNFIDRYGKSNFFDISTRKSFLEKENRENEPNLENLIILDLARLAYKLGAGLNTFSNYNVWEEIKKMYETDEYIVTLCDKFRTLTYDDDNIFLRALICADYERYKEGFIYENKKIIEEALIAIANGVSNSNENFIKYFSARVKYYNLLKNNELEDICNGFLISDKLISKDVHKMNEEVIKKSKKESIIMRINKIKESTRPDFATMINEPLVAKEEFSSGVVFEPDDKEKLLHDAHEQAEKIMEILKERDQIKKDAEEFAKIILKEQKERKKLISDAEEFAKIILREQKEREKLEKDAMVQAKIIFELQKENELLKALAEDNAKSIFAKEMKYREEAKLREVKIDTPIKESDVERINSLLTALSNVKELDFAVNHPTVLQVITNLEDKIITYLVTHKNIVSEDTNKNTTVITDFEEKKTPEELLSIIKNIYINSHSYEKDGRHTLMNISPTYDNKYRVTLYSVMGNNDDLLTEVYFEDNAFTEDVIKELCDIYSRDSIIVASKTDNIPGGKADYLVIDIKDNAIKFMGCKKEIVEIAKAYL